MKTEPKRKTNFSDLIKILRKVEDTTDMTPEVIEELLGAALAALALHPVLEPETSQIERLRFARTAVLEYIDGLIFDAITEIAEED